MTTITVNNPALLWLGRWGDTTIETVATKVAITGGSALRFQFTGTTLTLAVDPSAETDQPIISYSIDGGAYTTETVTASHTLATGLASGTHTAIIYVDAVFWGDTSTKWDTGEGLKIQGIVLDDGASVSAWSTGYNRRVLCYGDSITEGISSISAGENTAGGSARRSWSNLLSASVPAEIHTVAYGGVGLTDPGRGNVPAFPTSWPYVYSGIAKDDPNFLVIVNFVGHNDDAADATTFKAAYRSLLNLQHADHPGARILCIGPLSLATQHRANVQAVCAEAAYSGFCTYVDPSGWTGITYTDTVHPTLVGQARIAELLQATITEAVMGKKYDDAVLDAALNLVKNNAVRCAICSGEPANYAGIAAVTLGTVTISSADFTGPSDGTSGRKLVFNGKTNVSISGTGTAANLVFHNNSNAMYVVASCAEQGLVAGQFWDIPSFTMSISDPT